MKLPKVPYEVLAPHVDKLYEKEFDPSDEKGINEHCELIADFINSAGWTEEEWLRAMFNFDDPKTLN